MLIDAVPDTIDAVYAFFVAAILALLLVPASEWIARRIGAIDIPNERSLHIAPTPKLGGLAILVGVLVAGILFLPMGDGLRGEQTRAILAGAIAIAAVGAIDDVFDLHAAVKLAGQIGATIIPVSAGVTVTNFHAPFPRRRRSGERRRRRLDRPGGGAHRLRASSRS